MRTLVLARLFSGLAGGLSEGRWDPRGVPTFYKLIEGLQADPEIEHRTILFCKDPDPRFKKATRYHLDEAGTIDVIPWRAPTAGRIRKLDRLVTELDHFFRAVWIGLTERFDIVYATYALVLPAACLAHLARSKIVLRLMGIFPQHREMRLGRHPLFRWAMKAPYASVVCSEDGSDPSETLPSLLGPGVSLTVRLNGCDVPLAPDRSVPADRPLRVTFLGRLESYKGADLFIQAALEAERQKPGGFEFTIIGDGPLRSNLESMATDPVVAPVTFLGAVPHDAVTRALHATDIYVSVNLHGNLSNANLEALAAGCAVVLPSSDQKTPIDLATDRLISSKAARRYDRDDVPASLAAVLLELTSNRESVNKSRSAARETATELICSWTDRIKADIESLKTLAHRT